MGSSGSERGSGLVDPIRLVYCWTISDCSRSRTVPGQLGAIGFLCFGSRTVVQLDLSGSSLCAVRTDQESAYHEKSQIPQEPVATQHSRTYWPSFLLAHVCGGEDGVTAARRVTDRSISLASDWN